MSWKWYLLLIFLGAMTSFGGIAIAPSAVGWASDSPFEVVAKGLDNPRGLDFGPGGALYIAEAGKGGNGDCITGPLGPMCYGATGAVTRLHKGKQERVIQGLPSLSGPTSGGYFAFGPHAIKVQPGHAVVALGLDFTAAERADLGREGRELAHLLRAKRNGKLTPLTDLAAYEEANNSDGAVTPDGSPELRSNPHKLMEYRKGYLVVDSGANALLRVSRNGRVSTLATFPAREVTVPGSDQTVPMQSVPTAVARGPRGVLYVGELTGFPFPVGEARIYQVRPGREPQIYLEGFTHIVDLATDKKGNLYVLQIANTSLGEVFAPGGNLAQGSVIMVTPDGNRKVLVGEGLTMPTGMTIGPDGYLYVIDCGVCAGTGRVVSISLKAEAVEDGEGDDDREGENGDNGD